MRFSNAYSRPTLTPLGQRLLVLSERKLYDLDAPAGARESGTALLREVLVRETVRSAWSAVDEGREGGLSDWSQTNAMGLDVIGEDEEEEADSAMSEAKQNQWFEDLMSELGDEPEEEDEVYSTEATVLVLPAYVNDTLDASTTSKANFTATSTIPHIGPSISHIEYILPSPECTSPPPTLPITPIDETSHPYLPSLEDLEECDDLILPPRMYRSWSADSSGSCSDSEECLTPKLDCLELDEEVTSYEWETAGMEKQALEERDAEWDEVLLAKPMRELGGDTRVIRFRGF